MERKMRRFKQLLPEQCAKEILHNATNGVLSLVDSDGEPYGVPLSYAYDGEAAIYFHCAPAGHKMECIAAGGRCSFCVVGQDMIVPERFTTFFRSVIVSGTIKVVTDSEEKRAGLLLMCDKYSPGVDTEAEFSRFFNHVTVLRLDIERLTCKESIELVQTRGNIQKKTL